MSIDRVVLAFAGTMVLLSLALGWWLSPYWLLLAAFVGLNLFQSAFTGFCPLAILLKKLGLAPGARRSADRHGKLMKARPLVVWMAGLVGTAVLGGCGGAGQPPAHKEVAASLQSVTIHPELIAIERRLDGRIEAVNEGTVAAQTSGRVTEILYDVNDFVPAGAVIVRLRATQQRAGLMQAQAALSEATARESEAQTHYRRIADMYDRKVVPKATLDEAAANRDSAVARLAAARAGLDSAQGRCCIYRSPGSYAGVVTRRLVQVGETVSPGTALMSGLSLQFLRVTVDVPQSIVEQVRSIKRAAVYVSDRRIEATRVTVFPEATSESNTFRARLELPENATDLYPGMFVKVAFVTGEADGLLVPAAALVRRSEVTAVYVIDASGRTSLRQVRVGDLVGDRVVILSGLANGERVALDPLAAMQELEPVAVAATSDRR